jgi:MscS family membrane protein
VLGFLNTARKGDTATSARYLNTRLRSQAAAQLASQLFVVLDRRLPARLNQLSDRPGGSTEDSPEPNEELVGTVTSARGTVDILLERVARGKEGPLWYFSRETLESVPSLHAEVNSISVARYLPAFLTETRIGKISLFDLIGVLAGLPLLYGLLLLLSRGLTRLVYTIRQRSRKDGAVTCEARVPKPVLLFVLAWLMWLLQSQVTLPLMSRQFWSGVLTLMTILSFIWLALSVNTRIEKRFRRRFGSRNLTGALSILRFVRRAGDLVVILIGFFVILRYFGVSPTAAFAGLGVGGIAIALAAQKTLENVIGGLSLILDGTLQVGDFLKVGDTVGTVKEIGLRSTGIYTMERTVVSVPNGQISNVSLENFSLRDKFWFHHIVGLDRSASGAQIRSIALRIDGLLRQHPAAEAGSIRVRLIRFGDSSLDVELFTYFFLPDWNEFLKVQDGLLLQIMEIIEQEGTRLALPAQTLHFATRQHNGQSRHQSRETQRELVNTAPR